MLSPVRVFISGGVPAIQYIDSRLVVQNFVANARARGMTFTFNNILRTQAQQGQIETQNIHNVTGTSPHTAGVAFDVNISSSLKPNGIASLPDLTAAARMPNSRFSPLSNQAEDPPHFQANDLITRNPDGSVDQAYRNLIAENQQSFLDLEKLRRENPDQFNSLVTSIDSFTRS